jgi:hypothetical protein
MRMILLLLAILTPGAALADMTATYAVPKAGFAMKIEIASNGDVRGDAGQPGTYFITRGGHGFFIQTRDSRPIVMHVEDMATVMAEQMARLDPKFRAEMAQDGPSLTLVAKGDATINGRTGTAYFMQLSNGQLSPAPVAVMSHDPALAALGTAMARQFDMSLAMAGQIMGTDPFKDMQAVLKTGTPLVFSGAELGSVEFGPIAASAFELPGPPESLDGVRAAMTPKPATP